MEKVALVNKPLGLTPLQAIYLLKKQYPQYADEKIGFAGRLDPMAEGLLLLLIGDENKKRKEYEELPKTYEFSMLLGVSTDTYDLMGMITAISTQQLAISTEVIKKVLRTFIGRQTLPYPPYSSRTVNGIPLYKYARENRLDEIVIPTKHVTISSFELLSPRPQRSRVCEAGGSTLLPSSELLSYISRIIPKVRGNFRQAAIIQKWHTSSPLFPACNALPARSRYSVSGGRSNAGWPTTFPRFDFRITCSSGTYVRGIVHELQEKLGIPTVTYSIRRTEIGSYHLSDALNLRISGD